MSIHRRAAKVDANQPEIVKALRAIGATVYYIREPVDLLVGYQGRTTCLELKSSPKAPMRESQIEFFKDWQGGPAAVVCDVESALRAVRIGHESA